MTSSTTNVKVGACRVTFDGVDLGYTQGGVEVMVTTETHKVNVDQFGKSIINEIIMGRTISVKVPLAETTLENLVKIMPGAVLTTGTDVTKKRVDVPTGVGTDLLSIAKVLVLHPSANADANKNDDVTIPFAATSGAMQYAYTVDKERIFNVTFDGYPSPTTNLLYQVGTDILT
jgi:hypothetical protein